MERVLVRQLLSLYRASKLVESSGGHNIQSANKSSSLLSEADSALVSLAMSSLVRMTRANLFNASKFIRVSSCCPDGD